MKLTRLNEDKLKGGLADDKSIKDLIKHHGNEDWASIQWESLENKLKKQLNIGIKHEAEHVDDESSATEIAMDHLWEDPDYYNNLAKMENFNPKDRYMYNNPIMTRGIGTQDDNPRGVTYDGGYPGSSTGGTRTSPKKTWPSREDIVGDKGSDDTKFDDTDNDLLDTNIPDDTPAPLKKSNNTQPILKEPNDDWLNPKVAKHRGPGA